MWAKPQKPLIQVVFGLLLACFGHGAGAEAPIPDSAIVNELQTLGSHAALIFVGQIISVEPHASVVEVNFRVEQTVRGTPGARYTMREWAGLWAPGHMRYIVGQRVLAFVNWPSAAGFNSPVHGPEGLVPVAVQGADAPELLDIRRVAASVVRARGVPLPTQSDGAIPLEQALASLRQPRAAFSPQLTRLPIPLHAHPPAAMRPRGGFEKLASGQANGARLFTTEGSDAVR